MIFAATVKLRIYRNRFPNKRRVPDTVRGVKIINFTDRSRGLLSYSIRSFTV